MKTLDDPISIPSKNDGFLIYGGLTIPFGGIASCCVGLFLPLVGLPIRLDCRESRTYHPHREGCRYIFVANIRGLTTPIERAADTSFAALRLVSHRYCKLPPLYRCLPLFYQLDPHFTTLCGTLREFTAFTGNYRSIQIFTGN